jgi:tetratricopeptide (TPR) repeat protein
MARIVLTAALISLSGLLIGCQGVDSGESQLMPVPAAQPPWSAEAVKAGQAGESDIVEQVAINRQAYQQGLEMLVDYYKKTGNNMKLTWAKKELAELKNIPQYDYIIEAGVAGPDLKASNSIAEADYMFWEAQRLEKKAKKLIIVKNENLLRLALDKYNQLIRKHPSSDKIDDAAYRAAGIYEHFKDYTIAVLYYKRVYQWDPNTNYPAMYKQARILDENLHRRAEALQLYQQVVKQEGLKSDYKEFAERRIKELTKSEEELEESK